MKLRNKSLAALVMGVGVALMPVLPASANTYYANVNSTDGGAAARGTNIDWASETRAAISLNLVDTASDGKGPRITLTANVGTGSLVVNQYACSTGYNTYCPVVKQYTTFGTVHYIRITVCNGTYSSYCTVRTYDNPKA